EAWPALVALLGVLLLVARRRTRAAR
ncbi:MAG: hypothetical protein JWM62_430, partial [Frankiales bacterium]|nr:hypothetical protein [Frankiales bacterium]